MLNLYWFRRGLKHAFVFGLYIFWDLLNVYRKIPCKDYPQWFNGVKTGQSSLSERPFKDYSQSGVKTDQALQTWFYLGSSFHVLCVPSLSIISGFQEPPNLIIRPRYFIDLFRCGSIRRDVLSRLFQPKGKIQTLHVHNDSKDIQLWTTKHDSSNF